MVVRARFPFTTEFRESLAPFPVILRTAPGAVRPHRGKSSSAELHTITPRFK